MDKERERDLSIRELCHQHTETCYNAANQFGLKPEPHIFIDAQVFVTMFVFERSGGKSPDVILIMCNSAFSVELFLKAVIKERTGECRSHKLSDLFNRLPIEIQQEIMNDTNHSDFETQIERFSDAFVDFRYIYEDIFKTKDLNLKFWEDFSSAIYKIVPTHIAQKGAPLYIDPSIK